MSTQTYPMDGLTVHNGRVTIPEHIRDAEGAGEGDLVTLRLKAEGDIREFTATVDFKGRVTIPVRFRDEYGIDYDAGEADLELVSQ